QDLPDHDRPARRHLGWSADQLGRLGKKPKVRTTWIGNRQDAVVFLAFSAHLSFIISDRRFRAAGLMGLRLGADFPCQVAQRFFMASEMRLRAAALIPRRFLPGAGAACFALGGRPRRAEDDEVSPSSA